MSLDTQRRQTPLGRLQDFAVPDPRILPTQFFAESMMGQTPEQRLYQAILEDAWNRLVQNIGQETRRQQRIFREEMAWVNSAEMTWIASFASCCTILALDPGWVRKGIVAQLELIKKGQPVKRMRRNSGRRASMKEAA